MLCSGDYRLQEILVNTRGDLLLYCNLSNNLRTLSFNNSAREPVLFHSPSWIFTSKKHPSPEYPHLLLRNIRVAAFSMPSIYAAIASVSSAAGHRTPLSFIVVVGAYGCRRLSYPIMSRSSCSDGAYGEVTTCPSFCIVKQAKASRLKRTTLTKLEQSAETSCDYHGAMATTMYSRALAPSLAVFPRDVVVTQQSSGGGYKGSIIPRFRVRILSCRGVTQPTWSSTSSGTAFTSLVFHNNKSISSMRTNFSIVQSLQCVPAVVTLMYQLYLHRKYMSS